jgi:DNA (cytosine-5)-methyltransferase 1
MSKPRLLDLFCGGGGAGMGYYRAGFEVVGVDNRPMPRYPFEFHQGDALEYLAEHGHEFDAIHASPPCQGYSSGVRSRSSRWSLTGGKDEPKLIADTLALLDRVGKPYVIENVSGAKGAMNASIVLCGLMFGLPIRRHRLFETSFLVFSPEHPHCRGTASKYAELHGWDHRDMTVTGKGRRAGTVDRWSEIMGINWMIPRELAEAIPPVYTEYIGRQLKAYLAVTA